MTYRQVTTFVLVTATTLLTVVGLGERSFSKAVTHELTTSVRNLEQIKGRNIYLNSNTTISATDVTTHYIFLPMVVKPPVPEFVLQVVAETNLQRSQNGCDPVTLNMQLTDVAQGHSQDMALNDFFSHTGSNGSTPWERIEATGYQYSGAAENIAAGHVTPEEVMAAWMNSGGHRDNILDCGLKEIGVGYYNLEDDLGSVNYHRYWTQIFATPW